MKITRNQLRRIIRETIREVASSPSPLSGQVLTYGQVRKAFNQGQVQFLEITKDAQIDSIESGRPFLVNRSSSLSATYDPTDDPSEMLNPGDRLEIVSTDNPAEFRGGAILVRGGPDNIEFYIFGKDIKRHTRAL